MKTEIQVAFTRLTPYIAVWHQEAGLHVRKLYRGQKKISHGGEVKDKRMKTPGLRGNCTKSTKKNSDTLQFFLAAADSSVFFFCAAPAPAPAPVPAPAAPPQHHQHQQSSCSPETRMDVCRFFSCCSLPRWERESTLTHAHDSSSGSCRTLFLAC